jgi:hypothetical protein
MPSVDDMPLSTERVFEGGLNIFLEDWADGLIHGLQSNAM